VTTYDPLLIHLLTPFFTQFRKACRNVRLDVVLASQELNLSKRDADVAIRATDNPRETLVGKQRKLIEGALPGHAT
jgi:DNA-binding transcriptional LysR family regulator